MVTEAEAEGEGLADACADAEATGDDEAAGLELACPLGLGDAELAGLGEAEALAELEALVAPGELEAVGAGLMLLALDVVLTPAGCAGGSGCTETDGSLTAGAEEALPVFVVDEPGALLLVVAAGAE